VSKVNQYPKMVSKRNHCTFLSKTMDDSVEDTAGDIVVPPGSELANMITWSLPHSDTPNQLDHFRWEFRFRTNSKRYACVVLQGYFDLQASASKEWLIILSVKH